MLSFENVFPVSFSTDVRFAFPFQFMANLEFVRARTFLRKLEVNNAFVCQVVVSVNSQER